MKKLLLVLVAFCGLGLSANAQEAYKEFKNEIISKGYEFCQDSVRYIDYMHIDGPLMENGEFMENGVFWVELKDWNENGKFIMTYNIWGYQFTEAAIEILYYKKNRINSVEKYVVNLEGPSYGGMMCSEIGDVKKIKGIKGIKITSLGFRFLPEEDVVK